MTIRTETELITAMHAANLTGLHLNTVYEFCRDGRFDAQRQANGRWLIDRRSAEEYRHKWEAKRRSLGRCACGQDAYHLLEYKLGHSPTWSKGDTYTQAMKLCDDCWELEQRQEAAYSNEGSYIDLYNKAA